MKEQITRTERTKLKRMPKRASYERETIYKILDEGFVCHVGFTIDDKPFVIPTAYARVGDRLLIHGSATSRMLRALAAGETEICVNVTLIDGLVLARSAFHQSINYRSVVIFGKAQFISNEDEKLNALKAFTEHIIPNRWAEIRPPTANELKATTVLSLPLQEVSAKIRAGDPKDDESDYALDTWAGVIPLAMTAGEPVNDVRLRKEIESPSSVKNYNRIRESAALGSKARSFYTNTRETES